MPDATPDRPFADPTLLSATIYQSLHELAARQLLHQRQRSLHPTALVHEAWLRIARLQELRGDQRAQFFALAGKAMRSVVIDHARRRQAQKRGAGRAEAGDPDAQAERTGLPAHDVLALGEALARLETIDAELVRVVDLMFFCGKTAAEAAELLGASARTIERRWRFARAWLRDELSGDARNPAGPLAPTESA
jgi:RNA polymerase sigma factor (TIGR02999 family)